MIPEKLLKTAEAEYFCNVSRFIGLGEGAVLSPRVICGIKMRYPCVQDWIIQLTPKRRVLVINYVLKEYERTRRCLLAIPDK